MKAFVLSKGEQTTELCMDQLVRYGFDVQLLHDEKESMMLKYVRFLHEAALCNEGVLKVDADVIVNAESQRIPGMVANSGSVFQFRVYNFFTNSVTYNGILYYPASVINVMVKDFMPGGVINPHRPESSALRGSKIADNKIDSKMLVGLHGFFQSKEDMERVRMSRKIRNHPYDVEFISKIPKS